MMKITFLNFNNLIAVLLTPFLMSCSKREVETQCTFDNKVRVKVCKALDYHLGKIDDRTITISLEEKTHGKAKVSLEILASEWKNDFRGNPILSFELYKDDKLFKTLEWQTKTVDIKEWVDVSHANAPMPNGGSIPLSRKTNYNKSTAEFDIFMSDVKLFDKCDKIIYKLTKNKSVLEGEFDRLDFDLFKNFIYRTSVKERT